MWIFDLLFRDLDFSLSDLTAEDVDPSNKMRGRERGKGKKDKRSYGHRDFTMFRTPKRSVGQAKCIKNIKKPGSYKKLFVKGRTYDIVRREKIKDGYMVWIRSDKVSGFMVMPPGVPPMDEFNFVVEGNNDYLDNFQDYFVMDKKKNEQKADRK